MNTNSNDIVVALRKLYKATSTVEGKKAIVAAYETISTLLPVPELSDYIGKTGYIIDKDESESEYVINMIPIEELKIDKNGVCVVKDGMCYHLGVDFFTELVDAEASCVANNISECWEPM